MYLRLVEYGASASVVLSSDEAKQIKAASARWKQRLRLRQDPLVLTAGSHDEYTLAAKGVAGFIRVGRVSMEIAPKFLNASNAGTDWRSALWRFLAFAEGVEALDAAADAFVADTGGLADVLAEVFLASVTPAAVQGFPLGYRQVAEKSEYMKGRLDATRWHDMVPFTGTLPVLTRRLSRDVPTNRLLKWAAGELARTVESPTRSKQLLSWLTSMHDVSSVPPHPDQIVRPTRTHAHLVPAVDIALVLLRDKKGSFGEGDLELPGFLWDSDDLFERGMLRLFGLSARLLGLRATKRGHPLLGLPGTDGLRHTTTTPDIDVHDASQSRMILDAKYKVPGSDPANDDVYQLMAAGRVASVDHTALVYPDSGDSVTCVSGEPAGPGLPKSLHLLYVGLDAFASKAGVRSLAADLKDWLEERV